MALNQYVYDLDGDEPYLFVVKDPSEVNTSLYNREVTLTASNIEIFTVTVETWDRFGISNKIVLPLISSTYGNVWSGISE